MGSILWDQYKKNKTTLFIPCIMDDGKKEVGIPQHGKYMYCLLYNILRR